MKRILLGICIVLLAAVAILVGVLLFQNTGKESDVPAYMGNDYPDIPLEGEATSLEPTAPSTASPTPTARPTASPVPTAHPTASLTPTARPTVSPKPTVRPTSSPTPTARPTASPKPTARPTPSSTPAPTTAATESGSIRDKVFPFTDRDMPDVPGNRG